MKSYAAAVLLSLGLSMGTAFAADMTAPVKEFIDVVAGNWRADNPTSEDAFAEERLDRLFSADFAAAYREASKFPAYDPPEGETTGSPFDYDPIAGGQDGCPFENIRVEDEGDGQVTARFNNRKCFGDAPENLEDRVLLFHMQVEKGRPVIDDMHIVVDGNAEASESFKDELRKISE